MNAAISMVFGFGLFVVAGSVVIFLVNGLHWPFEMSRPLIAAMSFASGLGAVSLQIFLYSVCSLPLSVSSIAIPWLGAAAIMAWMLITKPGYAGWTRTMAKHDSRLSVVGGVMVMVILVQVGYCIVYSISQPISGWDAWAIWFLKAKAFFISDGIPSSHFFSTTYHHPDYPLLVPLAIVWEYVVLGGIDDQTAKIIFPLMLLALLVIFSATLSKETNRTTGLSFAALLAITPLFVMHGGGLAGAGDYVGYADLALSLYFFASATCLYRYQVDRDRVWGLLAFLFLGMGAWTKNEGLVWALAGSAILIGTARSWRVAGVGLGLVSVFVAPWTIFKIWASLPNDVMSQGGWRALVAGVDRVPTVLTWMWQSMIGNGLHGLIWPAFVISSALNWRQLLSTPLRSSALLVGVQLLVYGAVYLMSPYDVEWHLATSIDRVILHLSPIALWVAGVNVFQLRERMRTVENGNRVGGAVPVEAIGGTPV